MMATEEVVLGYYDLKVQKDELDRKMKELKSKSKARAQEQEKLSLFYQHELQQWLSRIDKDKIVWEQKRNHLSKRCTELQECIQTKWSSTTTNLKKEKEKYCNVIIKLIPEWQKVKERKQMKEISQYESKLSLIQQRRRTADIAFQKEKKLLSLISMRQKQIQKLQNEEKEDALIREHQRQLINHHENEYNDTLKFTKAHSFADVRLQQHIIRHEVTSELEKRFSNQLNDIKTKLLQNKTEDIQQRLDETAKSTPNYTKSTALYSFDDDIEDIEDIEEKNEEEEKSNVKEEEGKETEQHNNSDINTSIDINSLMKGNETSSSDDNDDIEDDTSKIEKAVGLIEVNYHQSVQNNQLKDIVSPVLKPIIEDTETNQKESQQNTNIALGPVTAKTEINKNISQKESQQNINIPLKPESTSKAETKLKTTSSNRAPLRKRSFRARTSKNRLSFSMLESPTKDRNHRTDKKDINSVIMKESNKSETKKATLSNRKIKSLNDFEEDNLIAAIPLTTGDNESSDDEFDF